MQKFILSGTDGVFNTWCHCLCSLKPVMVISMKQLLVIVRKRYTCSWINYIPQKSDFLFSYSTTPMTNSHRFEPVSIPPGEEDISELQRALPGFWPFWQQDRSAPICSPAASSKREERAPDWLQDHTAVPPNCSQCEGALHHDYRRQQEATWPCCYKNHFLDGRSAKTSTTRNCP